MLDNNLVAEKKESVEYEPLPDDMYQVELLDVNAKVEESYNSKKARATDPTLEPVMETVFDFQFTLLDGEENGKSLRGRNLWQNFVPSFLYISTKNGKNKLYQIIEAFQGSPLTDKQEAEGISGSEINALIGKQCRVVTKNKAKGDKIYTNIDSFLSAKTKLEPLTAEEKEAARVKPKDDEAEAKAERDFVGEAQALTPEDIPFDN